GLQVVERRAAAADARDLDVAGADQLHAPPALILAGLYDQELLDPAFEELLDLDEGFGQGLRGDGLFQVGQGPEPQAAPRVVRDGNDVHGDVPGAEVLFEVLKDHQSVRVR